MNKGRKTKKYDSEATKQRLKKAAIDVFAQKGFKAATLRMISQKAKVNLSMASRYFGGKDGLFESLLHDLIADMPIQSLNYTPLPTPEGEIKKFIESACDEVHEKLKVIRIVAYQSLSNDAHNMMIQKNALNIRNPALSKRLQDFKAQGKIGASVDIDGLVDAVRFFVIGIVFSGYILAKVTRKQLQLGIDGFCNQMKLSE